MEGLIPMLPSKKRLKEGDVFLVQPLRELFFCGKVIRLRVESRDSFVNGMNLIYFYDRHPDGEAVPEGLDDAPLLIPPVVINHLPWRRGYFKTIGNVPVTEREQALSFGFWDVLRKRFVDIRGEALDCAPQYWSDFGLAGYGVIGKALRRALTGRGDMP